MRVVLSPTSSKLGFALLFCAVVLLGACSVERYVTAENPIYTGATVELTNPETAEPSEKALLAQLNAQD